MDFSRNRFNITLSQASEHHSHQVIYLISDLQIWLEGLRKNFLVSSPVLDVSAYE